MTVRERHTGSETPDEVGTSGPNPFALKFTTPLYLGSALNPINSSLIATALVPISTALHVSVSSTTVLVSSLYLASSIAQPTAGKLSEEFGPRRVFLSGILLVLLGGLVGGFGRSLALLIVARVLIGIGTSAGYPSAMILIRRRANSAGMHAPPGGVLGGIAIAGTATAAVGPPIGGFLVGGLGWEWAFLINLPVAGLALALAARWVPRDPPVVRSGAREIAARIDVLGVAGFGGAMVALLVFVMGLPHTDWIALAVAVIVAVPLVWWELRTPTPFFNIRELGRNAALTRTYLRTGLTLMGVYTILYGLTQWIESGRGDSTQEAGLLLLPLGVVATLLSRPLSKRNLIRGPLIAAAISMLIGSIGILLLGTHSPVALIIVVSLVFGVTVATTTVGNQTAMYTQAPPDQIGTASGLYRTFSYIGSIASASVTGVVFRHRVTDGGLHTLAVVLIAAGAVVLAMTLLDRRLKTPAATTGSQTSTEKESHMSTTTSALNPTQTALLVMDYQAATLASLTDQHDPDALLGRVAGAIADIRAHGGTIAHVRVAFTEQDWAAVPDTNKAFSAAARYRAMHHEDPSSAIDQRLTPIDGDIVVRKIRFSSLSTTDLDRQLRDRGITTLVIAGLSTSGAVLSTVIDAADRDYRLYVLSDGIADPNAEVHDVLLTEVFPSRAEVIDTAELKSLLEEG
jgi:MFS family permease